MLRNRSSSFAPLIALAIVLISGLLLRDIIAGSVPAFRHDWVWPTIPVEPANISLFGTSSWIPIDLGSPNLYPAALPLLLLERVLIALGPHAALVAMLLICYIAAGCGMLAFSRSLGLGWGSALLASVAYIASPAMFDELIAGHFGDIVLLAAMPWYLYALVLPKRGATVWGIGAISAICASVQLQGYILCLFLAAPLAIVVFKGPYRWRGLGYVGMATIANLNSFIGLLSGARSSALYIAQEHAVVSWEVDQSAQLRLALVGRGYSPGYDLSWPSVDHAIFDVTILAIIALVLYAVKKRQPSWWLVLAAYVMGVAIVAGLNGPISAFWRWAFPNVQAASLFREFFHASSLITIGISLGIGLIWQFAAMIRARVAAALLGTCALLCLAIQVCPAIAGTSQLLHNYVPSPKELAFIKRVSREKGFSRFVIFPGRQPYDFDGSIGVDAMSYYVRGASWPIFAYLPSPILSFASDNWYAGNLRRAFEAYRKVTVTNALYRERPLSAANKVILPNERLSGTRRKALRAISDKIYRLDGLPSVRIGQVPLLVGGDFDELHRYPVARILEFMRLSGPSGPHLVYQVAHSEFREDRLLAEGCAATVSPHPSFLSADPSKAWVSSWRYGGTLPELSNALSPSVVTRGYRRHLPFKQPVSEVLALVSPDRSYRWYRPSEMHDRAGVVVAIALGLVRTTTKCRLLKGGASRNPPNLRGFTRISPVELTGEFRSYGEPGAMAFSDAYNSGWTLYIDGKLQPASSHFYADGFGNGWVIVTRAGLHSFRIEYARASTFAKAFYIEAFAMVFSLSVFAYGKISE